VITDFTSLLPFLRKLQLQQNAPQDQDDDDSPDPSDGGGPAPSQSNGVGVAAQSNAVANNAMGDAAAGLAQDTKSQQLMQLLQSGLQGGNASDVVTVQNGKSRIPRPAAGPDAAPPSVVPSNLQFNDPIQKRQVLNQLTQGIGGPAPAGTLPDGTMVQDMSYWQHLPSRIPKPAPGGWVASGNAKDPYTWVDECANGQSCTPSVAAAVGKDVIVYGSNGAQDKKTYSDKTGRGMIDVSAMAGHPDARFGVALQPHPEGYLDAPRAAALFNVAAQYRNLYANDGKLIFTAGSAATGAPATDEDGEYVHEKTHFNGSNIDMRYMGNNGQALQSGTAASDADVDRTQVINELFRRQNANLGAMLTGDPGRFGLAPYDPHVQNIHLTHMHFQNTYPGPPKAKK
jgi:hypothetical protein